jgi:hypothetical protein
MPPAIAWKVSRVLKVMTQAPISVPLHHGKFYEYDI